MPKSNKIFLIIAALFTFSVVIYARYIRAPENEAMNAPVYVDVERRTIENLITAQGTLEPSQEVEIGFTVPGIVTKVNFQVGDRVQSGQVVAELDPSEYQSQLNLNLANQKSLNADRRSAQNALEKAKIELNRASQLVNRGASPRATLEDAELGLKNAEVTLEKLEIEYEKNQLNITRDQNNLSSLKLIAPFDAIVTAQPFQIGQTVSANDNSKAKLSNLTNLINRAKVAEADIIKIEEGMEAFITILGRPNERIIGRVVRIEPTPADETDLVTYNVLLEIENDQIELFDGMTTQVFFILGEADDVLAIPVRALNTDKGRSTVRIEGAAGETEVETGVRDRLYVEIKSGLKENDRVMIGAPIGPEGAPPLGRGGGRGTPRGH